MFRNAIVLLLVAALVSGSVLPPKAKKFRPNGRIVGGTEVTIQDNPWQISLEAFGSHNCGGSIIAPDVIVTAAHCIDDLISFFYVVVYGSSNLVLGAKNATIKSTLVSENYDGLSNDIALVFLETPLVFDDKTQAIPLADVDPAAGDTVSVTGWGILTEDDVSTPNLLYGVDVTVVDRAECAADYADVEGATVDDSMVCAGVPEGGKDSCSGDSGGPLTKAGTLAGIVSWGVGCGEVGYPGVYTSVASQREWIRTNAGV